ncbi:medium-chain acyl-CoA ligase ACSF2, mitochondrial-like isoform X3 [Amblyomma americanum]
MGLLRALVRRTASRACSDLAGSSQPALRRDTLGDVCGQAARKWPDRAALYFPAEDVSLSFAQFDQQVDRVAQGLLSLDLSPGSRIGLLSPTCHRWIVCQFAAAKAGLVLTSCSALLVGEGFKKQDYSHWARELAGHSVQPPLSLHRYPALKYVISLKDTSDVRGVMGFSELLSLAKSWLLRDAAADVHSVATMLHSSGSTGRPKIIPLSHYNLVNAVHLFRHMTHFSAERTVMCCVMPLYHAFGHIDFSILGIAEGITTVYLQPGNAPAHTLACIDKYRCTAIQGTPTVYYDLMHNPEMSKRCGTSLCEGLIGATTLQPPALENIVSRLGIRQLVTAYGLTETAGPVAFGRHHEAGYRPMPHTELRVRNHEVQVRGPTVFAGYWDHDDTGLLPDGWLPSGDQAMVTNQGLLQIRGRIKDLVIKGGVNISPQEIEIALAEHESVREACVVGVPDARLGEELCAWVRLTPGAAAVSVEQLREHCRRKVNSLKVPRYIEIVDDFPRTSVGKISKPDIRSAMSRKLGA